MAMQLTLDHLNTCDRATFVAAVGDIFEHAPWVADAAASHRPFATVAALHEAMLAAVQTAPADRQLQFIRMHPELGSKVRRLDLTADSQSEQGSLGLDQLSDAEFQRFERANATYRSRFGFPFIICVRRQTRDAILNAYEARVGNDAAIERATAVQEIAHITRLRLVAKVAGPGLPKTTGRLSTHVLDTQAGRPAEGVRIVLSEIGTSARSVLKTVTTNSDGRTDAPLISDEPLRVGTYELEFHAGAYLKRQGVPLATPAFLDQIPIRFAIAEPEGHYHVPLLLTPWSYSTYRGS
jgi:2-oxo-4-hydroxy-4-carboxy-5-ureidoimidazoline decarboxylase